MGVVVVLVGVGLLRSGRVDVWWWLELAGRDVQEERIRIKDKGVLHSLGSWLELAECEGDAFAVVMAWLDLMSRLMGLAWRSGDG